MPWSGRSKFEARYERLRREAERTATYREADNDAPRVVLHSCEWNAEAIPPAPAVVSSAGLAGDLEARLRRREAAIADVLLEDRLTEGGRG